MNFPLLKKLSLYDETESIASDHTINPDKMTPDQIQNMRTRLINRDAEYDELQRLIKENKVSFKQELYNSRKTVTALRKELAALQASHLKLKSAFEEILQEEYGDTEYINYSATREKWLAKAGLPPLPNLPNPHQSKGNE